MKKNIYTINDVSKRTGMSVHTLRYYDKKGLLPFIKRSESGIRIFTEDDFDPLYTIHCLKESGMSLAKIKDFMDLYLQGNKTIEAREKLFQEQKAEIENQIKKLQDMLEIVEYKCWFFKEAKKYNDVYFYRNMDPEEYPVIMKKFFSNVKEFQDNKQKNKKK